jgi:hypothetical protein
MRALKLVSLFIFCAALLAGQAAYAEGELRNKELLEKSGLSVQINAIPTALTRGADELRRTNTINDAKFWNAWNTVTPIAYRADKILAIIDAGLDKDLTEEDKRAVLAFSESDLGKRVVAAENESAGAFDAIAEYAKTPAAYADRVELYKELDRESGVSETGAAIVSNIAVAMQVAVLTAMNASYDVAALRAELEKELAPMKKELEGESLNALAYTYRGLPVDDIKAYIEFLKTPVAKKFNAACMHSLNEALTKQTTTLGHLLVENLKSGTAN